MLFSGLSRIIVLVVLAGRTWAGGVSVSYIDGRPHCTVTSNGNNTNDVPILKQAFEVCGKHGEIAFPKDQDFWIAEKFNPVVDDVHIRWDGRWTFSNNITYWRNNSYHVAFQNHWAGFVLTGKDITIDGGGTGGVHGNGDVWYTEEAGNTQAGRPMPFVLWNVSNVVVRDFSVWQPQLWAFNIMNGTDILVENLYVNATATKAPRGSNWVQNTDGFDTMDARNVTLRNFDYTGGDDCIAIKPRSYDVSVTNITCHSGNGPAIGSLGQYLEDSSVENVTVRDVRAGSRFGFYIKCWTGALVYQDSYESEYQARGGGWGAVRNVTVENLDVAGAARAFYISEESGDSGGAHGGSSKLAVSGITLRNVTGVLSGETNTIPISCSAVYPCDGIVLEHVDQVGSTGDAAALTCAYVAEGGVTGLGGC
ncbi:putative extracellular exo-polygalacturonase [Rosellinia necatrix]|uniref:galacturonan 1,4-alpha-galacturonidase n=1 Tax=Rosellinia necatrix TaxID=77044 RepID=A0A1W2TV97_ROSNE|nr:putative extracellular exo-polygalacturonase [Rosellinia necatrix]